VSWVTWQPLDDDMIESMATRPSVLLTASAVVYLAAALPLLFASEELLRLAGVTATPRPRGYS
jgi:hypothetical protein